MSASISPAGPRVRRCRLAVPALRFAATVLACSVSIPLHSDSRRLTLPEVKASFLVTLAKFVEWPDGIFSSSREPVVFGIIGADPLDISLSRAVYGQSIKGRTVTVRKYRLGEDLRSCQVLFISASEKPHLPQILANVAGASVLTVSESPRFTEAGGVIQMTVEENRVRFSVNRNAAASARLQISAKLLVLGQVNVLGAR
jgi:hypothetical protein